MIKPPYNLRCEYLNTPIELDTPNPRFTWLLAHEERAQYQTAYQILVSSKKKYLQSDNGDLWNTGKVESDEHINIVYKGEPLISNTIYYWKVKWWDKNGIVSDFSEIAKFETAFLQQSDWKANWITREAFTDKKQRKKFQYKSGFGVFVGMVREYYGIYVRKEFSLDKKIKYARLYICGLGCYEVLINGNKVGDRILDPAWTDYKKIALYSTYDVSDSLREKNAIGVILGNSRFLDKFGFDFPKLIVQLIIRYEDETTEIICSDDTWKFSQGPILENGIYLGEKYDARLENPGWDYPNFNDSYWENAILCEGPKLASQIMPPIRITKVLSPLNLYSNSPGSYIYDFGQNFTGFIRLKVSGPRGTEVKMRFAEIVDRNGNLNTATNRIASATDIYILKGEREETYEPHFTYHGFRYVEIIDFPGVPTINNIEGLFIHTDVPKISDFYCSDILINQIHKNIIWGQLSNFMSIPTDCPQRDERHGWMGDAQLTVEEAIFNFDTVGFYTKYLNDIKYCQKENGALSDVVPPYWPFYPADPAWGTAYITIAWYLYWYYNDIRVLGDHYDNMKKYVDFLHRNTEENILYKFGKFGDWCPPGSIVSRKTPIEQVCTWYYYHDTLFLSKIAKVLGKDQDYIDLYQRSEEIKEAFNQKFLKDSYVIPKHSLVDETISQTSNILPLFLNMVPEKKKKKVLSRLLHCIIEDHDYHVDTGIVGTRYLWDVLTENGHADVAYKIITQESYPGYGYMIREGATTLWERWEKLEGSGMNSHNHIMLGSVDTWFYKTLAGISSMKPCWKKIRIKPYIPAELEYSSASLNSVKGIIHCSWEKDDNSLKMIVEIPIGSTSEIWIPINKNDIEIKEGNTILWKNGTLSESINGLEYKQKTNNHLIFNAGSGYFQFTIQ
ncbi:MAG: alpha-L-rhamnosidase [Promethearchaeota archaeon]|nr:MAG: alpha-L-rhamnosidase [Candidatus Lokiarchaeota archaeon]